MIIKTKKIMAFVLFVIISAASVPVSALAMNAPRVAVQMSMSTDVDKSGEVGLGEEITATVTWKGVLAPTGEPITIQVTNGAEILVHKEADVAFDTSTNDISGDGKYSMGTFSFNDSHALGVYVVEVILLDSNFNQIGSAKKEIEHIKSEPTYHDVSYIYKDVDSGEIMTWYKRPFEQGTNVTLVPEYFSTGYQFAGSLLNGETVESPVQVTITGPTEVVFLYHRLYNINIYYELKDGSIGGGSTSTLGYLMGTVTTVTPPYVESLADCKLVGASVNGEEAAIINGNQVQVTVTGVMLVKFFYEKP